MWGNRLLRPGVKRTIIADPSLNTKVVTRTDHVAVTVSLDVPGWLFYGDTGELKNHMHRLSDQVIDSIKPK